MPVVTGEEIVFRVWHVQRGSIELKGTVSANSAEQAKAKANVLWFLPIRELMVAP